MDKKQIDKLIVENKLCIDKAVDEVREKNLGYEKLHDFYNFIEVMVISKLSLELIDYKGDEEKYVDELRRYISKKYDEDLKRIVSQFPNVKNKNMIL